MTDRDISYSRSILWFAASTALLLLLIYFTGFRSFWNALKKADLAVLFPAFVLGSCVYFVWGFTWYRIFRLVEMSVSYLESLRLNLAAVFLNNATPFGQLGGEPLMAYVISSNTDRNYEEALSYVVSADILNILPSFSFIFGGTLYLVLFGSVPDPVMEVARLAAVTLLVVSALVYLLWFKPGKVEAVSGRVLMWIHAHSDLEIVKKIDKRVSSMSDTLASIGDDPGYHAKTVAVVHIGFMMEVLTLYLILVSLGVDPRISSLYFVLPLTDIALFSPSPGGIGTYEALLAGLLTALTPVEFSVGLVAALIYRLFTFWTGTVYGYIMLNTIQLETGEI